MGRLQGRSPGWRFGSVPEAHRRSVATYLNAGMAGTSFGSIGGIRELGFEHVLKWVSSLNT